MRLILILVPQPFNAGYQWKTDDVIIANTALTHLNSYMGSVTQQATSLVTNTDPQCYEQTGGCFSIYGFEVCRVLLLVAGRRH